MDHKSSFEIPFMPHSVSYITSKIETEPKNATEVSRPVGLLPDLNLSNNLDYITEHLF